MRKSGARVRRFLSTTVETAAGLRKRRTAKPGSRARARPAHGGPAAGRQQQCSDSANARAGPEPKAACMSPRPCRLARAGPARRAGKLRFGLRRPRDLGEHAHDTEAIGLGVARFAAHWHHERKKAALDTSRAQTAAATARFDEPASAPVAGQPTGKCKAKPALPNAKPSVLPGARAGGLDRGLGRGLGQSLTQIRSESLALSP